MLSNLKTSLFAMLLTASLCASLAFAGEAVDVNSATAEEIALNLNGVGSSKAAAIVAYRETNGPFQHADELINVKGIGLTTVDKNRDLILVSSDS